MVGAKPTSLLRVNVEKKSILDAHIELELGGIECALALLIRP